MPNWKQVDQEIRSTPAAPSAHDAVRLKYLKRLFRHTKRNVIIYYSGWLQKPWLANQAIETIDMNDSDKNAFMATIHGLDRTLGLDLFLHTPGGSIAAAESIVVYLRAMFGTDIRAIVPQLAMSAGTMVALACKQVVMGKHSSLGPIDPQLHGLPAHGIRDEFKRAIADVSKNPAAAAIWQPIISKYHPTLLGEAENAIKWSDEMVGKWLEEGMFEGDSDAATKAGQIVQALGDHQVTKRHERQISCFTATDLGINVLQLEKDPALQDLVLTVHHATMQTLGDSNHAKIVENHNGIALSTTVGPM